MSTATAPQPAEKPKMPTTFVRHLAALFGAPLTQAVLWYPHGDRNEEPRVAFVERNDADGVLALQVLRNGIEPRSPIRHIDDPWFLEHAAILKRDGAWDWAPGNRPTRGPKQFPVEVEAVQPDIVRHWNNGLKFDAIVAKVRGLLTVSVSGEGGKTHRVEVEDPATVVQVTLEELTKKK